MMHRIYIFTWPSPLLPQAYVKLLYAAKIEKAKAQDRNIVGKRERKKKKIVW